MRAGRRAAARSRSARAAPIPARTCSRCCSRRATRTAGRIGDQRAARRARHAAGRRPRDDRDGARRGPSSGSSGRRAAGPRCVPGGEPYAEAAGKEALRLRPVLPVVLRHLQAPLTIAGREYPDGHGRRAVDLRRPPAARRVPGPGALRPRALPRRQPPGRDVHLDPVRRRRAPLPRGRVRADGAQGRPGRGRAHRRGERDRPRAGGRPAGARSRWPRRAGRASSCAGAPAAA